MRAVAILAITFILVYTGALIRISFFNTSAT